MFQLDGRPGLDTRYSDVQRSLSKTKQAPKQLVDIFSNYAIFNNFCSHLDVSGINTVRKVTKLWSEDLNIHLKNRYNINKKSKRFVTKPPAFRSELGRYDALISGSFALQFFDGVVWDESDLDIFVEDGDYAPLAIGEYLIEREGYKYISSVGHQGYSTRDLLETRTYTRKSRDGQETKIQIIATEQLPVQAILRGFYTTAVVNFITWNKAYSIFPDCTFLERKTYMLQELDDRFRKQLVKYSSRGWMTLEIQWDEDKKPGHSLEDDAQRRVGDSKTWTMLLDTTDIEAPEVPDSVIEHACFSVTNLDPTEPRSEGFRYCIEAEPFGSCVLKYRYTFAGQPAISSLSYEWDRGFWMQRGRRLDTLTKIEIFKMGKEDQPRWFAPPYEDLFGRYHRNDDTFEKPSTWF